MKNKAENIYNDEDECDDVADDDLEASIEEDDEVVRIFSLASYFSFKYFNYFKTYLKQNDIIRNL